MKETLVGQFQPKLYVITETSPFMMSLVIRTSPQHVVVIDGGQPEDLPKLREIVGDSTIEAWILTHPHHDHISALIDVIEREERSLWPKKLYYHFSSLEFAEREDTSEAHTLEEFLKVEPKIHDRVTIATEGETFWVDDVKFQVLQSYEEDAPLISDSGLTGNETSLVVKVTGPEKSLLILGDTGPLGGERLMQRHWRDLKSDLVQMAHHGHSGVGAEVYLAAQPKGCIWCCPDWLYDEDPNCYADRSWGTQMTRNWMAWMGVTTHYVTKDGTQEIPL